MSISRVPLLRSSAKRRIVKSGGINRNMSQNATLPTINSIGYDTPRGPVSVSWPSVK